jgi:hypothetical protein
MAAHLDNFGQNIIFTPRLRVSPRSEAEIVRLLDTHGARQIRAVGSRHAWSDAVTADDVMIDMSHFNEIGNVVQSGQDRLVTVGAGCTIGELIRVLRTRDALTLPTIGTVTRQTVAGAISTATHGSGRSSLSHYVRALRVAAYDDTGRACMYDWTASTALLAARCGLGCTGIIISVTFECVPVHSVAEQVTIHSSLDAVLRLEAGYPLQEFALVPYLWQYMVYSRRVANDTAGAALRRHAYRLYKFAFVDIFFHFLVKAALSLKSIPGPLSRLSDKAVRILFRYTRILVLPGRWLTRGPGIVDRSDRTLTRQHHHFRHLEMELFVPGRHLSEATEVLRAIVSIFAGEPTTLEPALEAKLGKTGLLADIKKGAGTYTHHYPLYVRRVLPDETLVSMTADAAEPYYAIGIFCYQGQRRRFYSQARVMAICLARLYGARLHWGKYLPMFPELAFTPDENAYPRMPEFRAFCRRIDPHGAFRNEFSHRVLDLAPGGEARKRSHPQYLTTG